VCAVWSRRLQGVGRRAWRRVRTARVGGTTTRRRGRTVRVGRTRRHRRAEICECTIGVRQSEDIISLWIHVDDARVRERIRCVGSLLFLLSRFSRPSRWVPFLLYFHSDGSYRFSRPRLISSLLRTPLAPIFPFVHFAPSSSTWLASLTSTPSSLSSYPPHPSSRHS
jgi:hypothetical protein